MIKGNNTRRHKDNPLEEEFHDKFRKDYSKNLQLDFIAFGLGNDNSNSPADFLNDKEKSIMLSTIQWLGSPAGEGFLSSMGFTRTK